MREQTGTAAALIAGYSVIIGYTDNYVRVIAEGTGLWQFHAMRSAMAVPLLALAALALGLRLRPVRAGAVVARSMIHATAMVIYFGALAFLPVALVAAGLFTAPIFVLLISRFAQGTPLGGQRLAAVGLGFLGVVLVLGPQALGEASLAALLPVLAGALYALGNVATRAWCADESAGTLLGGFFVTLGLFGLLGTGLLWLVPQEVLPGAQSFVLRGPGWPSATVLWWTFVQAAGSLLGVGMMIRAYQIADAARVSVLEYLILPAAALWAWIIWGEVLAPLAWAGMALIALAGAIIALAGRRDRGPNSLEGI